MKITVNGRNVEVTPALKKYAEGKIGKFEKYLPKTSEATVTLSIQRFRHKVEVHIMAGGTVLQAQSITEELYSAIDEVAAKIDAQVKKLKGKLDTRKRKSTETKRTVRAGAAAAEPVEETEARPSIVRQAYRMKPMTAEEAALRLDMADQSFVVFISADSGAVCVLFKRKDGDYGLIEPGTK